MIYLNPWAIGIFIAQYIAGALAIGIVIELATRFAP